MAWDNNRANHVPAKVRQQCLDRDGHRCVATLNTGQRCPATTNLEAAHITQWQPGETTTADMVRTLCRWHHNRETQREAAASRRKPPSPWRPRDQHPGRA